MGETLRVAEEAGAVDILVNNAGIYSFLNTPDTDAATFDRHFALNTRAPSTARSSWPTAAP